MDVDAVKSLEDIKGRKVGIVGEGDEGNYLYRAMMNEVGYPTEANQLVVTGAVTQAAEALKKGTVDVEIWADTQRSLTEAQGYMFRNPWLAVYPGLVIFLTVLAINFLGDALRDALDPRSRG